MIWGSIGMNSPLWQGASRWTDFPGSDSPNFPPRWSHAPPRTNWNSQFWPSVWASASASKLRLAMSGLVLILTLYLRRGWELGCVLCGPWPLTRRQAGGWHSFHWWWIGFWQSRQTSFAYLGSLSSPLKCHYLPSVSGQTRWSCYHSSFW